jgi:hypothetical protein
MAQDIKLAWQLNEIGAEVKREEGMGGSAMFYRH